MVVVVRWWLDINGGGKTVKIAFSAAPEMDSFQLEGISINRDREMMVIYNG